MARKKGRSLDNHRHELFCHLLIFGNPDRDPERPKDPSNPPDTRHNATESYIHAGYRPRNRDSARKAASRLLSRVDIQARLAELRTEEQRIKNAFLSHWKSLLPEAQAVLVKAMAGEEVTTQALQAAREVIEQAQGPTRFRFGVQKGADEDAGLHVTIWSGRRE